jgi:hypothetical protein
VQRLAATAQAVFDIGVGSGHKAIDRHGDVGDHPGHSGLLVRRITGDSAAETERGDLIDVLVGCSHNPLTCGFSAVDGTPAQAKGSAQHTSAHVVKEASALAPDLSGGDASAWSYGETA